MSISSIQNFFKETITRAVTLTGATNIYVSALPTPDEGYVVISPSSSSLREIIYYTAKGTDSNGSYVTVTLANRGLGGTTAQTHAIGEPVRMNVTAEHIKEISDALDEIVAAGAQNASTVTKGITKLSVAPEDSDEPIAVGDNDPRMLGVVPGLVSPYAGSTAPTGWLICDGSAVSRTTYADLYAVIADTYGEGDGETTFNVPDLRSSFPIGAGQKTITLTFDAASAVDPDTDQITIVPGGLSLVGTISSVSASPSGQLNIGTHGLETGDAVMLTGTVPSGISTGVVYYARVLSTTVIQLHPTALDAINDTNKINTYNQTTGGTVYAVASSLSSSLNLYSGQAVVLAGASLPTGLSAGTYYVIKTAIPGVIKLASSVANANAGTAVNITADGSGDATLTINFSNRVIGESGGEENHALSDAEMPSHDHGALLANGSGGGQKGISGNGGSISTTYDNDYINDTGSDTPHNNMPPFIALNYIIKT